MRIMLEMSVQNKAGKEADAGAAVARVHLERCSTQNLHGQCTQNLNSRAV